MYELTKVRVKVFIDLQCSNNEEAREKIRNETVSASQIIPPPSEDQHVSSHANKSISV